MAVLVIITAAALGAAVYFYNSVHRQSAGRTYHLNCGRERVIKALSDAGDESFGIGIIKAENGYVMRISASHKPDCEFCMDFESSDTGEIMKVKTAGSAAGDLGFRLEYLRRLDKVMENIGK